MENVTAASDGNILRYERLRRGSYFADFRRDTRLFPEVYHCVIQREGSETILSWTQHRTVEAAIRTAEAELECLAEQEKDRLSKLPQAS